MNKSLLSKLMAREDLEVIEGNFRTASFDPKNRVVRLPILKKEFKEVTNLFIGHEIGHALYTPDFFSHEKRKEELADIPFDIINIVEDVRIERKVREFYPGLINDFSRGYKRLMEDDFFSIADKDPNTLRFLDRLNLKAKLNNLISVDFSFKETLMIEKVEGTETFDDTIRVSRELMEFIKENQDKEDTVPEYSDDSNPTNEESLSENPESSEDTNSGESGESGESEENDPTSLTAEEEEKDNETGTSESDEIDPDEETEEDELGDGINYTSDTDRAMRRNEEKLIHSSSDTSLIRVGKEQLHNEIIYSEEDLIRSNAILEEKYGAWKQYIEAKSNYKEEYNSFIKEIGPSVNAMVQQFELRKSAIQSKKVRESISGTIDPNKLWQYKLDDRIFKGLSIVPDAKNHGLLMYIDYSSSMSYRIYETLKQSIILSMFAKRVGIPFELYGFTTNRQKYRDIYYDDNPSKSIADTEIYDYANWGLGLLKLSDSSWSKTKIHDTFERAMFGGWCRKEKLPFIEPIFQMGGTPLTETASFAHIMASDFVKKHNTEKMNIIFLTDGDAQAMRLTDGKSYASRTLVWDIEGFGKIEIDDTNSPKDYYYGRAKKSSNIILESLRRRYNVIGFFLTDSRKEVGKDGYLIHENEDGYDSFIKVFDKRLKAIDDEFVTDAEGLGTDRKRLNTIKRDFKKFQKNKKMNKLIAQEFARLVA